MISSPERILSEWARPLVGLPLVWGTTDCGSLALAALRLLGRAHPDVQPYTTRTQAVAAWRALGGPGGQPVDLAHLQAGDLIVFRRPTLPAFHVFLGRRLLSVARSEGVVLVNLGALSGRPGCAGLRF